MQKVNNICSASQAFIVTNFSESKASKILVGKSGVGVHMYLHTHKLRNVAIRCGLCIRD